VGEVTFLGRNQAEIYQFSGLTLFIAMARVIVKA